jgi:hypothetical protein
MHFRFCFRRWRARVWLPVFPQQKSCRTGFVDWLENKAIYTATLTMSQNDPLYFLGVLVILVNAFGSEANPIKSPL